MASSVKCPVRCDTSSADAPLTKETHAACWTARRSALAQMRWALAGFVVSSDSAFAIRRSKVGFAESARIWAVCSILRPVVGACEEVAEELARGGVVGNPVAGDDLPVSLGHPVLEPLVARIRDDARPVAELSEGRSHDGCDGQPSWVAADGHEIDRCSGRPRRSGQGACAGEIGRLPAAVLVAVRPRAVGRVAGHARWKHLTGRLGQREPTQSACGGRPVDGKVQCPPRGQLVERRAADVQLQELRVRLCVPAQL